MASPITEVSPKPEVVELEQPVEVVTVEITESLNCFEYVAKHAKTYNVSADLMTRIIQAESGGRYNAKNPNSTATGCAQFTRATVQDTQRLMRSDFDVLNPDHNVEALAWWIDQGYIRKWDASKAVWNK